MNIAIAGFGWWGQHMAKRLQDHPRFSVVAIVEPDNAKATAIADAGMTGMGIHLTDYFISLFGKVCTVQAVTANRILGRETGDVVSVQLKFQAGMTATLSAILYPPHFIRLHVFG